MNEEAEQERDLKFIRDLGHARDLTQQVLKWTATKKCNKRNCGSVCKCEPCMAREALAVYDPTWRP